MHHSFRNAWVIELISIFICPKSQNLILVRKKYHYIISISLAVTVDSWRHGLWMHCLLRCNTWNNIAVKSRKDSELHDVTFVSEDGLLCPAHKVMLWSQNALPKFIFQNIALPKCPFHPLLHLIVGRKASLRPTSCQLDGEGSSLDESESELGFFHQWVKS